MLKLMLCALVVVVAVECSGDSEWEKFKSTHAKVYSTKEEEIKRRGIWEANIVYINQHNDKYNKGQETFFLGQNEFADMTNEEYRKHFLGYIMHNDTDGNTDFYTDENVDALPDRIDWRAYGYVTDVKRQKLRQCMYSKCNKGGSCTGYKKVKRYSEHALQSAVANVGPVAVGIDASHITFQLYLGGVYHNPLCNKVFVNHAALVTGYGALRSGSYWLVKNSFGPKWGYGGYVLMARYRSNNCGIATEGSYPTTS